jgi:malate synthase
MNKRVIKHGYKVAESLYNLVENEVLPDSGINAEHFWQSMADIFDDFMPKNASLLEQRETFQAQIDKWHLDGKKSDHKKNDSNKSAFSQDEYQEFLTDIGYIVKEKEDFSITTTKVDDEVALVAGPQLVVPLMNARFALNAANARWGSLYDALYGTDVITNTVEGDDTAKAGKGYNPIRGAKVTAYARAFLNQAIPLTSGSHSDVISYQIANSQLVATTGAKKTVGLKHPKKLIGYNGEQDKPTSILFNNNGLHIEIKIDPTSPVGKPI